MLKRSVTILFTLLLAVSLPSVASNALPKPNTGIPNPSSTEVTLDQIVAIVNNDVITQQELNQALTSAKQMIREKQMKMPSAAELRSTILDQLIYEKLQLQMAKRAGLTVSQTQITTAIHRIAKGNNITVAQLEAKVKQRGGTIKAFRKDLGNQIIVHQLQQRALANKVQITDAEMANIKQQYLNHQQMLQHYHIVDIVVSLPDSPTAAQVKTAQNNALTVLQKLRAGKSYQQAITGLRNVSRNDFGMQPLSDIPTLFANPLATMKNGQYAGPIRAPNGFHIIKLVSHKTHKMTMPTHSQLEQMLYAQKMQQALVPWLKQLRQSAYVKIIQQ